MLHKGGLLVETGHWNVRVYFFFFFLAIALAKVWITLLGELISIKNKQKGALMIFMVDAPSYRKIILKKAA